MCCAITAFHNFYELTVILFLNLNIFLLTQTKMYTGIVFKTIFRTLKISYFESI